MKSGFRCLAATMGALALCFFAGSWLASDYLIAPAPCKVTWPSGLSISPEEVSFPATDNVTLKGWFLPTVNSASAVVLLHGVRANRVSMVARAIWLHDLGYNVLLYDARGCGESDLAKLSFGYYETRDLLGSLNWLKARGMTEIGCIGCSQGAATILLASAQLPRTVHAIVAEASYATLQNTVDDHFRAHTGLPSGYFGALAVPLAEWKLGLEMDNVSPLREISKLKVPVYLIGGAADNLAPPEGIRELYESAPNEKQLWMVPAAGHADFFSYAKAEYQHRIGDFIKAHLTGLPLKP